jgi:multidrug efflux system membrane fusion protein
MEESEKNIVTKRNHPAGIRRRWPIVLLVICLVAFGMWAIFHQSGKAARKEVNTPVFGIPVVAMAAKKGDFPVYLTGLGTITPVNTVTVKTRIDGQLMEVLYKEGQIVSAGDILAKIDPRPFEVQLTQAEGQMARDLAFLKNAQLDLERYRVLWEQDSIPKQQLDTQEALVRQYEGIVQFDQG